MIHFYEQPDVPLLFDLSSDQGEVNNIAQIYPQEHQKLHSEMMRYLTEVGARIPKPNPDYDHTAYKMSDGYEKRMAWGPFKGRRKLDEDEIKDSGM